jgi:hypothetical protein
MTLGQIYCQHPSLYDGNAGSKAMNQPTKQEKQATHIKQPTQGRSKE